MLAKSTKRKRRHQAEEARRIEAALWNAVPESWETDGLYDSSKLEADMKWASSHLARFPRGKIRRHQSYLIGGNADFERALGHATTTSVLRIAGLI